MLATSGVPVDRTIDFAEAAKINGSGLGSGKLGRYVMLGTLTVLPLWSAGTSEASSIRAMQIQWG